MTPKVLAPHVLSALFQSQAEGTLSSLDTLVDTLKVRRADIRRTVTSLHQEGHVNVLTMRLTMTGLALGSAYASETLPALRKPRLHAVAAA